jgi:hypothetical protein
MAYLPPDIFDSNEESTSELSFFATKYPSLINFEPSNLAKDQLKTDDKGRSFIKEPIQHIWSVVHDFLEFNVPNLQSFLRSLILQIHVYIILTSCAIAIQTVSRCDQPACLKWFMDTWYSLLNDIKLSRNQLHEFQCFILKGLESCNVKSIQLLTPSSHSSLLQMILQKLSFLPRPVPIQSYNQMNIQMYSTLNWGVDILNTVVPVAIYNATVTALKIPINTFTLHFVPVEWLTPTFYRQFRHKLSTSLMVDYELIRLVVENGNHLIVTVDQESPPFDEKTCQIIYEEFGLTNGYSLTSQLNYLDCPWQLENSSQGPWVRLVQRNFPDMILKYWHNTQTGQYKSATKVFDSVPKELKPWKFHKITSQIVHALPSVPESSWQTLIDQEEISKRKQQARLKQMKAANMAIPVSPSIQNSNIPAQLFPSPVAALSQLTPPVASVIAPVAHVQPSPISAQTVQSTPPSAQPAPKTQQVTTTTSKPPPTASEKPGEKSTSKWEEILEMIKEKLILPNDTSKKDAYKLQSFVYLIESLADINADWLEKQKTPEKIKKWALNMNSYFYKNNTDFNSDLINWLHHHGVNSNDGEDDEDNEDDENIVKVNNLISLSKSAWAAFLNRFFVSNQ